jgi:hypothetical protein
MRLTQQLQHEERRNAMGAASWQKETPFDEDSDDLEDIPDPILIDRSTDSDSDAPGEWVGEEIAVVSTSGAKRTKVTIKPIKPKVPSPGRRLPPSLVHLAENVRNSSSLLMRETGRGGKNHKLTYTLLKDVLDFGTGYVLHFGEDKYAIALFHLNQDIRLALTSKNQHKTGENNPITQLFRLVRDIINELGCFKQKTGEDENSTKKKPGKHRGMVDYIREANQKS